MREFLVPDRLVGSNAWWCSKCQADTPTDKSMSVYQHSPFLAICLKRFNGNRKITGLVRFDQQLTLRPISHRPSVQQLRYDLYGVINHVGSSLDHGHYFSFCLDGPTWRRYDDERVSEVSARELVTPNAFVLLYRLRK
jgi:ubiquitin carboxyl-terminal hydrolase 36/42